jgi:long-chain acyl-CoA synthetase
MGSIYEERPWLVHYGPSSRAAFDLPTDKSVIDLFYEATEKWKNNTALIFYGNKISYKELREKVDRLATALAALGIKKGDTVGFLMLNSPEFVIASYAVARIGAVQTPISPVYVSSEIKHQVLDSGAEHIICQDILYEGLEKTGIHFKNVILTNISDSLPKLKKMLGKSILRGVYQKMAAPSPEILKREGIHQLQELLAKYPPNPPAVFINPREDLFNLPYTGGTTGPPKGVMITHYNTIANYLQAFETISVLGEGKETLLGFMPFYHAGGQFCMNGAQFRGNTMVIITTPDLDETITSMIKYNATYFVASPTMYEMLKDYEKTDRVNWKKLKVIQSGADSLLETTAKDWEERTGTSISEGYGMTETTAGTHFNPIGKQRYGSIGIPVANTYAAILNPDEDVFMPVGEIGEIVVCGPQVTKGYWKKPEATKECESFINGRRWWRTGDLGRMEADGFFYVYDRKRDLIKYKGLRVFAREVEEVLKEHPHIRECGVVGQPDPVVGSYVKAVIVLESDARGYTSEQEIIEYCKGKMAAYKIPKIIEFVGEIPKTDIGKVSRREIRTEEA